jgi:hypothetical protein
VYELLVAVRVIPIGTAPGDWPVGGEVVLVAALLALAVGAGVSLRHAFGGGRGSAVWALLPLVAAAYVVVRWYSFDPYFAPTHRRHSEGVVAGVWIASLVVGALAASSFALLLPRVGAVARAVVLLLCATTAWAAGLGH